MGRKIKDKVGVFKEVNIEKNIRKRIFQRRPF